MKQVEVYTDGACSGNPGPGGWGAAWVSCSPSLRPPSRAIQTAH